jgi:hypothetical protein
MGNEHKTFIHELESMGLRVEKGNSGHMKVYLPEPDGRYVMDFTSTSGDRHWQKGARRRLRIRLVDLYGE